MKFEKTKVLLKKINAIHDGVAEGGAEYSSLERDLILEYIRDLYECIRLDESKAPPIEPKPATAEVPKVNIVPPVTAAPKFEDIIPRPIANGEVNGLHKNGHVSKPEPQVVPTTTYVLDMDPEMEELFAEAKLGDLSQRYANTPIQDISKAMGINERILTINELFKGDQQQFQTTSETLNGFTSFAEAKTYLSKGPARNYDWLSSKRKKKAAVFIKLVRRRYL